MKSRGCVIPVRTTATFLTTADLSISFIRWPQTNTSWQHLNLVFQPDWGDKYVQSLVQNALSVQKEKEKKTESRPPQTSPRPQHFCIRASVSMGHWLQSFKAGISFHSTWGFWVNTNISGQDKPWKRNMGGKWQAYSQSSSMFKHLKRENDGSLLNLLPALEAHPPAS